MDVTTPEEARIAEEAGAVAVMALERVPADIRKDGGVARMSDPSVIKAIKEAVTIPVMAKARIGHFVEAQILEALGIDYIDESEVVLIGTSRLAFSHHEFLDIGADTRRRDQPHQQAQLHRAVCVRLPGPGRSPAPHR